MLSQDVRCETIEVEGEPLVRQRAYVIVSHVGSIQGLEFGIAFAPEVFVESWTTCADASTIATDSTAIGDSTWTGASPWPTSGSGIALAWSDPIEPDWPDSSVVIGYFTLSDDSQGVLSIAPHPERARVAFVDKWFFTHELPPVALGRVDVAGLGLGYNPCGLPAVGPLAVPLAPVEEAEGECVLPMFVDCGELAVAIGDALWTTDFDSLSAGARELPTAIAVVTDALGSDEPVVATRSDSSGVAVMGVARTRTSGEPRYHVSLDEPEDPEPLPRGPHMIVSGDTLFLATETVTTDGIRIVAGAWPSANPRQSGAHWRHTYHDTTVDGDDRLAGFAKHGGKLHLGGLAASGSMEKFFAYTLDSGCGSLVDSTVVTAPRDPVVVDLAIGDGAGGFVWLLGAYRTSSNLPAPVVVWFDRSDLTLVAAAGFPQQETLVVPTRLEVGGEAQVAITGWSQPVGEPVEQGVFFLVGEVGSSEPFKYRDTVFSGNARSRIADTAVPSNGGVYVRFVDRRRAAARRIGAPVPVAPSAGRRFRSDRCVRHARERGWVLEPLRRDRAPRSS